MKRRDSGLFAPEPEGVQLLDLQICKLDISKLDMPPIAGAASFSIDSSKKILDHIFNDGTYSAPSPYLALCTATPTDSSTGSTITEATYTGYARLAIAASDMSAASGTTTATKTNSAALTFAACTSGSSTITAFAICDASTAGNVIGWGTCTSTVISTTQTPATVAIGGLVVTLD